MRLKLSFFAGKKVHLFPEPQGLVWLALKTCFRCHEGCTGPGCIVSVLQLSFYSLQLSYRGLRRPVSFPQHPTNETNYAKINTTHNLCGASSDQG